MADKTDAGIIDEVEKRLEDLFGDSEDSQLVERFVTEELTRLESHLDQYALTLRQEGEMGRRLEFLVQEMLREANTIGAKSGDTKVSRYCVDLKVELDRLREQVQNVE